MITQRDYGTRHEPGDMGPFLDRERRKVVEKLQLLGLEVSCLGLG